MCNPLQALLLFILSHFSSFSFQIVNPHLLKDLTERGLWNEEMKNQIIACNGSIQVQNDQKNKVCSSGAKLNIGTFSIIPGNTEKEWLFTLVIYPGLTLLFVQHYKTMVPNFSAC